LIEPSAISSVNELVAGKVRSVALPNEYRGQGCSLARTLEVIGERWTLLIIRDAFYGARRFGEFVEHLGIPRAVLTERLHALVDAGVLKHNGKAGRGSAYTLTAKGIELWPAVRAMMAWGDRHYAPDGAKRVFRHRDDDAELDDHGACTACGATVEVSDTLVTPGPGLRAEASDALTVALRVPHPLLEPFDIMH
jgi:DNA-binding HxlR family transcriptional regulator